MVWNHRKPLKAMVEKWKTIEKPLMAMVRPPKNIQWWWSPQKPLKICNGLFKTIENYNGFLKTIELVNGSLKLYSLKRMELSCGSLWFGHCTWLSHEKKEPSRVSSLPTMSCSSVINWYSLLQDKLCWAQRKVIIVRLTNLKIYCICCKNKCWETFSLLWNDVRSQ